MIKSFALYKYIFISILISCNSSRKEEATVNSSDIQELVDDESLSYSPDPAVEGDQKKATEKITKDSIVNKLHTKDTLRDLSKLLNKTLKNDSIIYWKTGDITNDAIDDFIVVLQSTEEPEDSYDEHQRKVVLLQTIDSYPNFKLRAINKSMVGCSNCGGAGVGDPFQGVTIKNNYFSIEELYGACSKSFIVTTFKYDTSNDNWFLHKIGQDDYSCIVDSNSDGNNIICSS